MQNSNIRFYNTKHYDLRRAPIAVRLSRGFIVGWLRILAFVSLDAFMITLGWMNAQFVVHRVNIFRTVNSFQLINSSGNEPGFLWPILLITLSIIASAYLYGERQQRRKYIKLAKCLLLAQCVLLVLAFLYQPVTVISRSAFLLAGIFTITYVVGGRLLTEGLITSLRHQGTVRRTIALIGHPQDTRRAKFILKFTCKKEFNIVDCLDLSILNNPELPAILDRLYKQDVGEIFICSWQPSGETMELYWRVKTAGLNLRILPLNLEIPDQRSQIEMIGGMPTIKYRPPALVGSDFWTKRIFDISVAGLFVFLTLPIYVLIALAIYFDSPGPIFYRQTRVGLRGKNFKVWKFRTMVVNAEQLQKQLEEKNEIEGGVLFKMKNDPRITKVGRFLRRYSLDELPQLFNVLVGEMSLVGPRPLPVRDVEGFSQHHFVRHNVTPGITGLWQVSGRSDITNFEQAFRLDVAYINNWSLTLDFRILFRTIKVVLHREGAY